MVPRHLPATIAVAALLSVVIGLAPALQQAQAAGFGGTPDLSYNFYTPPAQSGHAAAALYVTPRPVPPLVGHTYITYQPLMPHEFLYRHFRFYKTNHSDSRPTRTFVVWW